MGIEPSGARVQVGRRKDMMPNASSPATAASLWHDRAYRRLWSSLLLSAFAAQMSSLALALTAALLLHATASQIAAIAAFGTAPYVLFMLPAGVWLDRVRKLPVYFAGEVVMALALAAIPLAWAGGRLSIEILYLVSFVGGCVSVASGTAGQIVLTQVVRREQLVEAHAKNRIAATLAEIVGPGLAGLMIRALGAPLTLLVNSVLMLCSVLILVRLKVRETPAVAAASGFWPQLVEGIRFVAADRLLLSMALAVGAWQVFQTCAMVTEVLFATRELGLDEIGFGMCLMAGGAGTVGAGFFGHRLARRYGPGPCLIAGIAASGVGWLQLAVAPAGMTGVASFILMLVGYGTSIVLIFSNMLALRQAITPAPLLARMTSTMRWLTLFPAWPGTLLGGALAEAFGLRIPLALGGTGALLLALWLWVRRGSPIRAARTLPERSPPQSSAEPLSACDAPRAERPGRQTPSTP